MISRHSEQFVGGDGTKRHLMRQQLPQDHTLQKHVSGDKKIRWAKPNSSPG
ncbi:MAG: hypothetical protein R3C26_05795 [Calditrichia bacterium]